MLDALALYGNPHQQWLQSVYKRQDSQHIDSKSLVQHRYAYLPLLPSAVTASVRFLCRQPSCSSAHNAMDKSTASVTVSLASTSPTLTSAVEAWKREEITGINSSCSYCVYHTITGVFSDDDCDQSISDIHNPVVHCWCDE